MGGPRRPRPQLEDSDAQDGGQGGYTPKPYVLPNLSVAGAGDLTEKVLAVLGRRYAEGDTDLMAASACWSEAGVCVSHEQLRQWLSRGRKELALHEGGAGPLTIKAQLARVWAHARGHAARQVLEEAREGVRQRVPPKWYQSELNRLNPGEFSETAGAGSATVGGFRLMTPEEAEEDVANKMSDFLARRAAEAAGG